MISQRHRGAVLEFVRWKRSVQRQTKLAIADKVELVAIAVAPLANQRGLAMDEKADRRSVLGPAKSDRRAALRLIGQISGLAPF